MDDITASNLSLVDGVRLSDGLMVCDMDYKCQFVTLCMFMPDNLRHLLQVILPRVHIPAKLIRQVVAAYSRYIVGFIYIQVSNSTFSGFDE